MTAEQSKTNEKFEFTRESIESVCVSVCVCVRERERERVHYWPAMRGVGYAITGSKFNLFALTN